MLLGEARRTPRSTERRVLPVGAPDVAIAVAVTAALLVLSFWSMRRPGRLGLPVTERSRRAAAAVATTIGVMAAFLALLMDEGGDPVAILLLLLGLGVAVHIYVLLGERL